jgi:hypothetical protein
VFLKVRKNNGKFDRTLPASSPVAFKGGRGKREKIICWAREKKLLFVGRAKNKYIAPLWPLCMQKNIDVYVTQHLCYMSQMTDKKAGYSVSRRFAHDVCVKN